MRYIIFKRGGYNQGTVGTTGGEVSGKLILSRDPIGGNEAASKNYTSVKFNTLLVNNFINGIVPANRIPEFGGDIVKLEGTGSSIVKATTVSTGTYPKVTVNIKGQVTVGNPLNEEDIPILPWNKILTGKPSSVGGYGIIDALSTSGGTMTGKLKVNEVIGDLKSLVNKNYIDSLTTGGGGVVVGGVVYRNSPITPSGFLKCNGGELSKATYPELFDVIGDQFGTHGRKGYGHHWRLQHGVSEVETANLSQWSPDVVSLPRATFQHGLVVGKNRVYIIGGATGGNDGVGYSTVFSAIYNSKGELGSWTQETSIPAPRHSPAVCVANNFIYVIGGWHNDIGHQTVYRAKINEDGTLSIWDTLVSVPEGSYGRELLVIKNRLVLFGGVYRTTHYADLNEDGSLGEWTLAAPNLPVAPAYTTSFIIKDKLYLTGSSYATVYVTNISSEGEIGEWSIANTLPANANLSEAIVLNDKVYILGGDSTGTIYVADANPDGTIGNWSLVGSIGYNLSGHRVAILGNRIYSIGGRGPNTSIRYSEVTGVITDYSYWYDPKYFISDITRFRLPEIIPNLHNTYAYIKF